MSKHKQTSLPRQKQQNLSSTDTNNAAVGDASKSGKIAKQQVADDLGLQQASGSGGESRRPGQALRRGSIQCIDTVLWLSVK